MSHFNCIPCYYPPNDKSIRVHPSYPLQTEAPLSPPNPSHSSYWLHLFSPQRPCCPNLLQSILNATSATTTPSSDSLLAPTPIGPLLPTPFELFLGSIRSPRPDNSPRIPISALQPLIQLAQSFPVFFFPLFNGGIYRDNVMRFSFRVWNEQYSNDVDRDNNQNNNDGAVNDNVVAADDDDDFVEIAFQHLFDQLATFTPYTPSFFSPTPFNSAQSDFENVVLPLYPDCSTTGCCHSHTHCVQSCIQTLHLSSSVDSPLMTPSGDSRSDFENPRGKSETSHGEDGFVDAITAFLSHLTIQQRYKIKIPSIIDNIISTEITVDLIRNTIHYKQGHDGHHGNARENAKESSQKRTGSTQHYPLSSNPSAFSSWTGGRGSSHLTQITRLSNHFKQSICSIKCQMDGNGLRNGNSRHKIPFMKSEGLYRTEKNHGEPSLGSNSGRGNEALRNTNGPITKPTSLQPTQQHCMNSHSTEMIFIGLDGYYRHRIQSPQNDNATLDQGSENNSISHKTRQDSQHDRIKIIKKEATDAKMVEKNDETQEKANSDPDAVKDSNTAPIPTNQGQSDEPLLFIQGDAGHSCVETCEKLNRFSSHNLDTSPLASHYAVPIFRFRLDGEMKNGPPPDLALNQSDHASTYHCVESSFPLLSHILSCSKVNGVIVEGQQQPPSPSPPLFHYHSNFTTQPFISPRSPLLDDLPSSYRHYIREVVSELREADPGFPHHFPTLPFPPQFTPYANAYHSVLDYFDHFDLRRMVGRDGIGSNTGLGLSADLDSGHNNQTTSNDQQSDDGSNGIHMVTFGIQCPNDAIIKEILLSHQSKEKLTHPKIDPKSAHLGTPFTSPTPPQNHLQEYDCRTSSPRHRRICPCLRPIIGR